MKTCSQCGVAATTETLLPVFAVNELGIKVAVKYAALEIVCGACGATEVEVPDLCGLIAAAAVTRVQIPVKLDAGDMRFLRKAMGLSARELADELEVTPETISRWENGKIPIGPSNEKLLRFLVGVRIAHSAPGVDFDEQAMAAMRVQAIRRSPEPVSMEFDRVLVKTSAKTEKKYATVAEAA